MLIKYRIKGILVYLLYNIILLTISYFMGRFYQMLMFVLFYSFIQNCFNYRFHADSFINDPIKAVNVCKIITISVELIYLAFCKDLDISVYSNLFIIFAISLVNCLLEFGIRNFASNSHDLKDKDKLLTLCRNANLTKNATDRMILKYIEG